jgi:hypothetical protein
VTHGAVNAHTHLYSGLAPLGMPAAAPPPRNFLEVLERVWWRLDRALDERSLRAAARLYVAEARTLDTAGLVDHHESPRFIDGSLEVLADACQELGMPALLCYGATERNDGRDEARRGLAECARFVRANRRPLVRGAVGIHASFTVSDETLREAGALARELGAVVHVHVAEDAADVADARRRGFDGPLQRLIACDALPAGSILAHGVHRSRAEVRHAAACTCRARWSASPRTAAAGWCRTRVRTRRTVSAIRPRWPRPIASRSARTASRPICAWSTRRCSSTPRRTATTSRRRRAGCRPGTRCCWIGSTARGRRLTRRPRRRPTRWPRSARMRASRRRACGGAWRT